MPSRKKTAIRTVGIVVRPDSNAPVARARRLATWLRDRNVKVLAHDAWSSGADGFPVVDRAEMMRSADLVVVLGGDGSLLGMARLSGADAVPVVGIHHGDFGFLTDSEGDDPYAKMNRILKGDCEVEHRTMLSAAVRRGGRSLRRGGRRGRRRLLRRREEQRPRDERAPRRERAAHASLRFVGVGRQ